MKPRNKAILPLASALAALAGNGSTIGDANAETPTNASNTVDVGANQKTAAGQPNKILSTGEALFGFITTDQSDGTIVAQHVSHESHASHYSSR